MSVIRVATAVWRHVTFFQKFIPFHCWTFHHRATAYFFPTTPAFCTTAAWLRYEHSKWIVGLGVFGLTHDWIRISLDTSAMTHILIHLIPLNKKKKQNTVLQQFLKMFSCLFLFLCVYREGKSSQKVQLDVTTQSRHNKRQLLSHRRRKSDKNILSNISPDASVPRYCKYKPTRFYKRKCSEKMGMAIAANRS